MDRMGMASNEWKARQMGILVPIFDVFLVFNPDPLMGDGGLRAI